MARLTEYVEIHDGRLRCTRCATEFCDADANYKLWVLQARGPVTDVPGVGDPSVYGLRDEMEFRRYFCPGCAVQLETEIAPRDAEPLWDVEVLAGGD
jgi:N-methylhydantoinase B